MAVTLKRLKEIISDIVVLSSKIAVLHEEMRVLRSTHQQLNALAEQQKHSQQHHSEPTEQEIKEEERQQAAEAQLQKKIMQHEGLLDYLINTFPWTRDNETSLLDQIFETPPVGKTEQEKLRIVVDSTLKKELKVKSHGPATSDILATAHWGQSIAIYDSHAAYISESSSNYFPPKVEAWNDIPAKISKDTHAHITSGQVTRHFEYQECLSSALEEIDNQIGWAQLFNQSEKIEKLKTIKTLILSTTYDNESSLITQLEPHKENPIAARLIVDFQIIATDVKVAQYRIFQASLLDIKNKITSATGTKKATLGKLVQMCNAITPDKVTHLSLTQLAKDIIKWKNDNHADLNAHRHGADIGLTESMRLVNNLIDSLEPIALDKTVTQYCNFQEHLAGHLESIQNKIYWLRLSPFYSEKAEKIAALQNLLQILNNITETTVAELDKTLIAWKNSNNEALKKPRIKGSTQPTQSQALVTDLIIALNPVTANPDVNIYAQYQTRLAPSIKKINQQLLWLNFYWGLCFVFKFMNRTATLDVLSTKITAFNTLLHNIYAIKIDTPTEFKETTFKAWRGQYNQTLTAHTFASNTSEKKTTSASILEELSSNLDEIDTSQSNSKTKLIN